MDFSQPYQPRPQPRRHDFDDVARMLLGRSIEVCRHLLPGGRIAGAEYVIGDLSGSKGKSLSINVRSGTWKDFAGGPGGADLIALWAAVRGIKMVEAKAEAEDWLGIEGAGADSGHRVIGKPAAHAAQPPAPSMLPDDLWWRGATPARKWDYLTADGEVVATVYRYEHPTARRADGKPVKVIRPWNGRDWQAPPAPRPLYRLPAILQSTGTVVVVEGEKAADAVVEAGFEATTCLGGAQAARQTDWKPLHGRDVLLWQDVDKAGGAWLATVSEILREVGVASARVVR